MEVGGLRQRLDDVISLREGSQADPGREVEEWMDADLVVGVFVIRRGDRR